MNYFGSFTRSASDCGIQDGHFAGPGKADLRLESVLKAATCGLERHVKRKIILGVVLVALGTAFGVAKGFSGDPMPPCKPEVNCPVGK
jgi:hypothetical protein